MAARFFPDAVPAAWPARVNLLYGQARTAALVTLINATLLAGVHVLTTPPLPALCWWLAMLGLTAARLLLCAGYRRRNVAAPAQAARWAWAYTLAVTLTGLGWGSIGWVLFPSQTLELRAFSVFVLGGMVAGGVPLLTAWWPAAVGFVAGLLVPTAAAFAFEGTPLAIVLAIMLLVFLAGMGMTIRLGYRAAGETLALQATHDALLDQALAGRPRRPLIGAVAPVAVVRPAQGVAADASWQTAALREAIDADALTLHYQPILDLREGGICGVEALVRWPHPTDGLLGPERFIPLAEAYGQIVALGDWVLRAACRQQALWRQMDIAPDSVAVNLSAHQLAQPEIVVQVMNALRSARLEPSCLTLELTESVLIDQPERAVAVLQALQTLGVRIAIDDFGTGYSSLSYLQRLPVTELKLDRSFVYDLTANAATATIVSGVIQLAHRLQLTVTVEGVEDRERATRLCAGGADRLQGYWLSRPMDADAMTRWLLAPPALDVPAAGPGDNVLPLVQRGGPR